MDLDENPCSVSYLQCDLGQVTDLFWASISSPLKWVVITVPPQRLWELIWKSCVEHLAQDLMRKKLWSWVLGRKITPRRSPIPGGKQGAAFQTETGQQGVNRSQTEISDMSDVWEREFLQGEKGTKLQGHGKSLGYFVSSATCSEVSFSLSEVFFWKKKKNNPPMAAGAPNSNNNDNGTHRTLRMYQICTLCSAHLNSSNFPMTLWGRCHPYPLYRKKKTEAQRDEGICPNNLATISK